MQWQQTRSLAALAYGMQISWSGRADADTEKPVHDQSPQFPKLLAEQQKKQQQPNRRASYGQWLTLPLLSLTEEEKEGLTLPPTGPDGEVLRVDYRLTVFHLGKVDTAAEMAKIKMGVVLYWTDSRMVGWTSPVLPPTLWGPELYLRNAIDGVSVEYEQFVVANPDEGRMKRVINYEATIITPMVC